jgi:hypothetical protein
MRKFIWQISLLLVLSMLTMNALAEPIAEHKPNQKAPQPPTITRGGVINAYSLNWAGYALESPVNSVTDVKGSWIVPSVTCSKRQTSYSAFWLGIDGYNSDTVEQIGTSSDCRNGKPTYYAWWEFYPLNSMQTIDSNSFSVSPGDKMSGEVTYNGNNNFTLTITNYGTGKTFSKTGKVSGAQRSSAEWIAEAPSSIRGTLPLANFGTVNFGNDSTGDINTNFATIYGTTGNIASFNPSATVNVSDITMVTMGGAVKAQPSDVSTDGTSFYATWYHS